MDVGLLASAGSGTFFPRRGVDSQRNDTRRLQHEFFWHISQSFIHKINPDRQRYVGAIRVLPEWLLIFKAHPHTGNQ